MENINSVRVVESPKYLRVGEGAYYQLDTDNYGGSPTSVSVTAYDTSNSNANVTSDVLTGSASVSGDIITLPKVLSSTARHLRVVVQFSNARFVPAKPYLEVIVVD